MGLLREFKEFAMKGSFIDLAVGVIMGVAFNNVVKSLVNDVIMPPIGLLLGAVDFAHLALTVHGVSISYGKFINTLINFTIVAAAVFLLIKQINLLRRTPPAEPTTKPCPRCCSAIPLRATRCPCCTSELPAEG